MSDNYPKLTVAAIQAAPLFLDREKTLEKACQLIMESGEGGANLAVFPECFIPAFPYWYRFYKAFDPACVRFNRELFKNAVEIPSYYTERLCQAAKKANIYVVMGLNEKRPGMAGTLYNTMLVIHRDGSILGKHQKLMPSSIERLVHGLGDGSTLRVFPTEYGSLGCLCCGENGNPLFRFALTSQGEMIHAASWPTYTSPFSTGYTHEQMLLRARNCALEGKVYVVSSAEVFTQETADVLELDSQTQAKIQDWGGYSAIFGPKGQCIAGPAGSGKTIFGISFLMNGIQKGESSIYISFEQRKHEFYEEITTKVKATRLAKKMYPKVKEEDGYLIIEDTDCIILDDSDE